MQRFHQLYEGVWRLQTRLIYIDEAHIHRDMDIGYTWALKGKPAWRLSDSAPLAHRNMTRTAIRWSTRLRTWCIT